MVADLDVRGIALLITLALFAFIGLRYWYHRRLAARMFADAECDNEVLEDMRETLQEVSRESRTRTFTAARLARITLRDRPITIVDGWVTVPMATGAESARRVFAVAHRDQADWLRHFADVFDLAFAGSVWSVFWVKLPTLMRLTRRRVR